MGTSAGNHGREMYSRQSFRERISAIHKLSRVAIRLLCKKCNSPYSIERKMSKSGKQLVGSFERQYCSRRCANGRQQTPAANASRSQKLNKRTVIQCKYCSASMLSGSVFCSRKCHGLYKTAIASTTASAKSQYIKECQFKFSLNEYPALFDFSLIEQHGWYHPVKNPAGISRDHSFSISAGWAQGVSPLILSHPANCKLLLHTENAKKQRRCDVTLEELLYKIQHMQVL